MTEDIALLKEIVRLLHKYGEEAFQHLATNLRNPEYTGIIADLLDAMVEQKRNAEQSKEYKAQNRRPKLTIEARIANEPEDKAKVLQEIYDKLKNKSYLPQRQEILEYATKCGIYLGGTEQRKAIIQAIMQYLIKQPLERVNEVVQEMSNEYINTNPLVEWDRIMQEGRRTG